MLAADLWQETDYVFTTSVRTMIHPRTDFNDRKTLLRSARVPERRLSWAARCSTNARAQILLRQAPQTLDHVARAFGLSHGERAFLLCATPGQGLLLGSRHVGFHAVAADTEHALITTDPRDPDSHRADYVPDLDLTPPPDAHRDDQPATYRPIG